MGAIPNNQISDRRYGLSWLDTIFVAMLALYHRPMLLSASLFENDLDHKMGPPLKHTIKSMKTCSHRGKHFQRNMKQDVEQTVAGGATGLKNRAVLQTRIYFPFAVMIPSTICNWITRSAVTRHSRPREEWLNICTSSLLYTILPWTNTKLLPSDLLTYDEYAHNDIIHACMSITLMMKCLHSVFTACKRGGGARFTKWGFGSSPIIGDMQYVHDLATIPSLFAWRL